MTYDDKDCWAEQVKIMKDRERKRNREKKLRKELGFWRYWWRRISW